MLRYFLCFLFPFLVFELLFDRRLIWVFLILNQQLSNWRKQSLNICLCFYFCPTFALIISERNCLLTGNCDYSRMICNDAMCKSIAIFNLIEKAVYHIPMKSLVLTTHIVSMTLSMSIGLSV